MRKGLSLCRVHLFNMNISEVYSCVFKVQIIRRIVGGEEKKINTFIQFMISHVNRVTLTLFVALSVSSTNLRATPQNYRRVTLSTWTKMFPK